MYRSKVKFADSHDNSYRDSTVKMRVAKKTRASKRQNELKERVSGRVSDGLQTLLKQCAETADDV